MNNYYEQDLFQVMFGCRFNKIKEEFEQLLIALKSSGAELIFTSKDFYFDKNKEIDYAFLNKQHADGMEFLKKLESTDSKSEVSL